MDLLEFKDTELYFEEALPAEIVALLDRASAGYGGDDAELALLRAYFMTPENLTVLVALYRYYFYQHRLRDALTVVERAIEIAADRLGLPRDWRRMDEGSLAVAASRSFGLLRFHLLAMKALGVVLLRLQEPVRARACLAKLADLDRRDQLGVRSLLQVVDAVLATGDADDGDAEEPFPRREVRYG